MVSHVRVSVDEMDGVLAQFGNQIRALSAGEARKAMARAVNRAGRTTASQIKRTLARQTSIPRAIINATVKERAAAHKGDGAIEFTIYARGSELPLRMFAAKQFTFGVRAKVWGKMQRFPSAFINAGKYNSGNPAAGGHVLIRTGGMNAKSGRNNAFERMYGPSIPKEMLLGAVRKDFQEVSRREVEKRLRHELGRLLS